MDMLRVFHPISSLPDSFVRNSKRILVVLFIISVVIPGIISLVYIAIFGVPPVQPRLLIYTILANMMFCVSFTMWQLFYTLFILRRYLQEQLYLSAKRRKKYKKLMVWVFLLAVHDMVGTALFCIDIQLSRIRGITVCTHFILMAIIFQKMVDVTFPKGHDGTAVASKLNETALQMHPITIMENAQSIEIKISIDEQKRDQGGTCSIMQFPRLTESKDASTSIVERVSHSFQENSKPSIESSGKLDIQ
jgi:hypothetical protein